jgi:hypothetical protein
MIESQEGRQAADLSLSSEIDHLLLEAGRKC